MTWHSAKLHGERDGKPLAAVHPLLCDAAVVAAGGLGGDPRDPSEPADHLALHRADPSYIWTEEMARFLFIWTIMIGAMVGVREGPHFEVDVWPRAVAREPKRGGCIGRLGHIGAGRGFHRRPASSSPSFAWYRISELAELPLWLIHMAWPMQGVDVDRFPRRAVRGRAQDPVRR